MRQSSKYENEKACALILLRHLNRQGYDYEIKDAHTPDGWADVDVFAVSSSERYPPLYLQVCFGIEPGSPDFREVYINSIRARDVFTDEGSSPVRAVEAKYNKYIQQRKNFSEITLVVKMNGPYFDDFYLQSYRAKCSEWDFKAIWFLYPPDSFGSGLTDEMAVSIK